MFSLYLGVAASAEGDITATLNALDRGGGTAVVFFPADQVAQCADQIRQAAGRGHKVGLIPTGDTAEDQVASVDQGSQVLAAILRQETWFVLGSDEALTQAGYLCWTPSLTFQQVRDATTTYETLVEAGDGSTTPLRVLVDSQQASGALAVLSSWWRTGIPSSPPGDPILRTPPFCPEPDGFRGAFGKNHKNRLRTGKIAEKTCNLSLVWYHVSTLPR